MLEISLPIRPRINTPAEYLTTVISLFSSLGIPVLNLTTINFPSLELANQAMFEYVKLIKNLLEPKSIFVAKDGQKETIEYAKKTITGSRVFVKNCQCLVCDCKKYEELVESRTFNQRRVINGNCTYCKSELKLQNTTAMFLEIDWPVISFDGFNFDWVEKDWLSFKKRQNGNVYKVSKEVEKIKVTMDDIDFGIRHQLLWALEIIYISKLLEDKNIQIHFVERVKDLVFFICSIIKTFDPEISIHLKGCPSVWLEKEKRIIDITDNDIEKIRGGLFSKRKEIHV